ncbi:MULTISPECIES: hypothetical protein [Thalassospira]|uniref:Uncharacterized protein n=1 Tax=Thalassospira xiamenensis TaxID=220697 RepID=A0ABR5XXV9_9PROT|nr:MULTISPECIES: hypothetical protein [Thalassospira]KZC97190.1 hypothetical protein AUP40_04435 [Thalassospira xiamenensis]KZD10217.1 hypothetical protein AUP45_02775 [Thalassospira xiamenensis]MCD1593135.1 hypothetical protein [Thalassospira xiamenensis]MDM7975215.1 hypothetical protein [Thalassospira xiamenensis]OHZ01000.1 hypothetical protein BC440_09185 [Thalassospira sp. MIT1004]
MVDTAKKSECWVCDGAPPAIFRGKCEKHDVCDQCGTPRAQLAEIPWGTHGGFLCQPCDRKNKAELIAGYDSDDHDDSEWRDCLKCPNCGKESHPEMEDYRGEGEEYETNCPHCDLPMKVVTTYTVEWSTAKAVKGGA